MGSGFDDRVYVHFFIIVIHFNSSHIELLLNDSCLTNLCKEYFTALNDVFLTNKSLRRVHGSLYRLARIHGNPCKWFFFMKKLAIKQPRFYCWLYYLRNVFTEALLSRRSIFRHNMKFTHKSIIMLVQNNDLDSYSGGDLRIPVCFLTCGSS
jgi:hypothetical protein